MPPRHVYWTIIAGGQPTAFRAAEREELLPTLKQLQSRHPDATMMWFARGKLWPTKEAAEFALRQERSGGRESRGREWRPGGEHKDPRDRFKVPRDEKRRRFAERAWRDRNEEGGAPRTDRPQRPWRPTSDRPFKPREDRPRGDRPFRPEGDRPQGGRSFKPKGARPGGDRPFRPKGDRPQGDRPFRPKGDRPGGHRPKTGGGGFKPRGGPRGGNFRGGGGGKRGGGGGGRGPR
jgi:23S rRNA pseudouridine2605 synthase